jgi:pyruvate/2-oxoglutarate dehydrogenase complex dihydrolipoamide acyltransferase (E2) component
MQRSSVRRKLAIATWDAPREGNIYGRLALDATRLVAYLDEVRERSGIKVTIGHVIGRCVALALKQAPGLNGIIRFGSFVPHDTVDISFLVAFDEGRNLGKAKIEEADTKSIEQIASELDQHADKIRGGKDENLKKSMDSARWMPTFLLRWVLILIGYMSAVLGWSVKSLGVERYPFGACCITNVGMFGLDEGYVPPTPFARCPIYVLIGALKDAPRVVDGAVTVRKELVITATIDHRYIDGAQGAALANVLRAIFEDPTKLELAQPSA